MYYIENKDKLGHKTALVYSNKYVNNLQLGCDYDCKRYKIFCPEYLKGEIHVPDFFKNFINKIL